jgi:osmotically-inducible protein OsmY
MQTALLIKRLALVTAWFSLITFLTGCATQKVDWNARVGTYTYYQAVVDMGPPTKQAKLEDGTLVAEWETQRGYAQTSYVGGGYYGRYGYHGGYAPMPVTTVSPTYFIRLTFAPDGKLQSWKRVAL